MFRLTHFRFVLITAVAVLILLLCAEPAFAGGIGSFFSGLARRDRVIQVCVVVMLLALFIMIKKFNTPGMHDE